MSNKTRKVLQRFIRIARSMLGSSCNPSSRRCAVLRSARCFPGGKDTSGRYVTRVPGRILPVRVASGRAYRVGAVLENVGHSTIFHMSLKYEAVGAETKGCDETATTHSSVRPSVRKRHRET
jgi:hypothetical protein